MEMPDDPLDFAHYTLLVVDDNPTNIGVLVDYLEELGFDIIVARNGEMGLKRAETVNPNLILLDVMMPGIDGFETCRRLKANSLTKHIPIIFMTALDSIEDKVKGFNVGGVDYVTKPIQQEEVLVRITTHLRIWDLTTSLHNKIDELTKTRHELVQSEKMASLGRLVSGFAHELNTPIGIAVTTASTLQQNTHKINKLLEQEEVNIDVLLSLLGNIDEGAHLTLSNLERAAELVTSFKRTAVDQSTEEIRQFSVKTLIEDTLTTLHNKFKKTSIIIETDCDKDLVVYSLPGAIEQILTNLLLNSLIHAFDEGVLPGKILISAHLTDEQQLHLEYTDTGKGIDVKHLEKLFEPFFTTHRGRGGSGLGTYICYNLVTTKLQGTITCQSEINQGVKFTIEFPIQLMFEGNNLGENHNVN